MRVLNAVIRAGGVARRTVLLAELGRSLLDRAAASGALVRLGRHCYGLPDMDEARQLAHRTGGLLCLSSAALLHRWEVKTVPERPHILLRRGRRIPADLRPSAQWHRGDWLGNEAWDGVATSRELTLTQCVRSLPEDEALAIVDSALRHGEEPIVRRIAATVRGPGRPRMLRILAAADGRPRIRSSRCCAASASACRGCRSRLSA